MCIHWLKVKTIMCRLVPSGLRLDTDTCLDLSNVHSCLLILCYHASWFWLQIIPSSLLDFDHLNRKLIGVQWGKPKPIMAFESHTAIHVKTSDPHGKSGIIDTNHFHGCWGGNSIFIHLTICFQQQKQIYHIELHVLF